jgi:hypothetical protein
MNIIKVINLHQTRTWFWMSTFLERPDIVQFIKVQDFFRFLWSQPHKCWIRWLLRLFPRVLKCPMLLMYFDFHSFSLSLISHCDCCDFIQGCVWWDWCSYDIRRDFSVSSSCSGHSNHVHLPISFNFLGTYTTIQVTLHHHLERFSS